MCIYTRSFGAKYPELTPKFKKIKQNKQLQSFRSVNKCHDSKIVSESSLLCAGSKSHLSAGSKTLWEQIEAPESDYENGEDPKMFNFIIGKQADCFDQKFQNINECNACNDNKPCSYSKVYDKNVIQILNNVVDNKMVKHLFTDKDRDFIKNIERKACYNLLIFKSHMPCYYWKKLFENYLFPIGESNSLLPYSIDSLFEVEWKNGCLRIVLAKDIKISGNAMENLPINVYFYCHEFLL